MMKRPLTLLLVLLSCIVGVGASNGADSPLRTLNPQLQIATFAQLPLFFGGDWRLVGSSDACEMYHQVVGAETITLNSRKGLKIRLGVEGDKSVARVAAPDRREGYKLIVDNRGITLVGHDSEGLFYGLQTLRALLLAGRTEGGVNLHCCTIEDWPEMAQRGVVEGFYGTPWNHSARLDQMEYYGRNKLNTYVYGPKDDPWHRGSWREPYPPQEAARLGELVEAARRNRVTFYWAIHPGGDIRWNDQDRDALVAKFEQMYALGVKAFAVFFDDIGGEGAKADKQAELLNHLNRNFVAAHPDVEPLMLCPTEYNRAWSNEAGGYLRTLGENLDSDIRIMWTGNRVISTIDHEAMEWINERIGRKGFVWLNFPVNDYVRDHLLLGPVYGNAGDVADDVAGFVSNPMEYAEASKVALYSIADYTWNTDAYLADESWERSLCALLPSNHKALRTFALHNKDMGENVHQFRREEGSEIEPMAARAIEGDSEALVALAEVCGELEVACQTLLGDNTNQQLITELRPWLMQGVNVARWGKVVVELRLAALAGGPTNELLEQQRALREAVVRQDSDATLRHPYQTGTKVGSRVLVPTLEKLVEQVENGDKGE